MPADLAALSTIEKRSRQATRFTLIGVAIVLLTTTFGVVQLRLLRRETAKAQQDLQTTLTTLEEKKKELNQVNTQLSFRQNVYSQLLQKNAISPALVSAAAENALQANPKLGDVSPIVNIHISRPEQLAKAKEIESSLEALGYKVPAIIDVGSKAPNSAQVRYFFRSDAGPDLQKIQQVMQQAGVPAVSQFIGMQQPPPNLRPKEFEIWFGLNYPPAS